MFRVVIARQCRTFSRWQRCTRELRGQTGTFVPPRNVQERRATHAVLDCGDRIVPNCAMGGGNIAARTIGAPRMARADFFRPTVVSWLADRSPLDAANRA